MQVLLRKDAQGGCVIMFWVVGFCVFLLMGIASC